MVRVGTKIGKLEYTAIEATNNYLQKLSMEQIASCPEELEILLVTEKKPYQRRH